MYLGIFVGYRASLSGQVRALHADFKASCQYLSLFLLHLLQHNSAGSIVFSNIAQSGLRVDGCNRYLSLLVSDYNKTFGRQASDPGNAMTRDCNCDKMYRLSKAQPSKEKARYFFGFRLSLITPMRLLSQAIH